MIFDNLTEKEKISIHKLTNYGLAKAAQSLEQILKTSMETNPVSFGVNTVNGLPEYCTKKEGKVHLLKTHIIGDIKGMCYLVFSEDEVVKIHNKCLPPEILSNNSPESRLIKLEMLTEVDNIVTASVITQFANYLKLKIYGHVPSLHIKKGEEVNKYIQAESIVMSSTVQFRSYFYAEELDISPEFIWLLEGDFIKQSKKYAKKNETLELY